MAVGAPSPPEGRFRRWLKALRRWLKGQRSLAKEEQEQRLDQPHERCAPPEQGERIGIACSGGGIRSASFNLGALQALQSKRIWPNVDYISAVSGGSYIASAHFVARANSDETATDLFAHGSPEERYLRNHSSYLSPDVRSKVDLIMNIVHGLVWNLILLFAWMVLIGRPLGWLYASWLQRGLTGTPGDVSARPWMFRLVLPFLALAVLGLFLERGIALFDHLTEAKATFIRAWARRALVLAAVCLFAFILVPLSVLAVRWLVDRPFSITDFAHSVVGFAPWTSLKLALTEIVAAAGVVLAAYRLLTAPKFGWVMRLAAFIVGPLLLLVGFSLAVSGAAAHGFSAGELVLFAICGFIALLIGCFADINLWGMHEFYKERLSSAFAIHRTDGRAEPVNQDPERGASIRLSQIRPRGWPKLIMCTAVNVSDQGLVPPGRGADSFTFTCDESGSRPTGRKRTGMLEERMRPGALTLPSITAASGAALSPTMGKMTRRSLTLLMALANVRLGIWVPNPERAGEVAPTRSEGQRGQRRLWSQLQQKWQAPGPFYLLLEALGVAQVGRKYVYITDGGHIENLGLVELVRRGCTRIYCFDASGDALNTFNTIGEAIALARSELDVTIDIDLSRMAPHDKPGATEVRTRKDKDPQRLPVFSGDDHAIGTIGYPNGATGDLIYVKTAVIESAPADVLSYRQRDPVFPCHPTTDQLFEDEKFEAYRKLGEFSARRAIDHYELVQHLAQLSAAHHP